MKAISIRQPEAWLVVNGHKDTENRRKPTRKRGFVAVHASSRRMTRADWSWLRDVCEDLEIPVPDPAAIRYGGVVGVVEIVDCVTSSDSLWFEGPYGYVLGGYLATEFLPCKGALGWFDVDVEIVDG